MHFYIFMALFSVVSCRTLPERLFKTCYAKDGDISTCFKEQIVNAIPEIGKGIPELKIPKLDPLELPEVKIDHRENENLWMKAEFKNLYVDGFKDIELTEFSWDPKNLTTAYGVKIPNVFVKVDYDAQGVIMGFPLEGKGHFEGNFSDNTVLAKTTLEKFKKNEVDHMKIVDMWFDAKPGNGTISFKTNDPELQTSADYMSDFFNEDPKKVLKVIEPIYTKVASKWIKKASNAILKKIPTDEIFVE